MSAWRRKALELIPEKRVLIESSESPGMLWVDLTSEFEKSFKNENNELINKILKYLDWCTSEAAGDLSSDTQQAVRCGFLEDITRNRKHWLQFKKWFSRVQFEKYKGSFMYALSDTEFKELESLFYDK